jgi:hypothetical protein
MSVLRKGVVPAVFVLGGMGVIVFGLIYYLSPVTRLRLYGTTLDQRVALSGAVDYLLGCHSHVKSWTEHAGTLDTPLADETTEEVGTLRVERWRGATPENSLQVIPKEWIRSLKNASGFANQMIPLNHPSIGMVTVLLDQQNTLLERREGAAWRSGKAAQFLVPKFPKGVMRRGNHWKEPLQWRETTNDWTIGWEADLVWVLKDFEMRDGHPCALLTYDASLHPTLLQPAFWAKAVGQDLRFTGQAHGEALFNVKEKTLISNTLTYEGSVRIPVNNLEDVPEELRVGIAPVHAAGDVVLQFEDTVNLRLP